MNKITCGGCSSSWIGLAKCHCASCHLLFSSLSSFDRHRRAGKCLDPFSVGMEKRWVDSAKFYYYTQPDSRYNADPDGQD